MAAAVASAPVSTETKDGETRNGFGEIVKDSDQKGVVGLIYPPPEVRNIVDRTAAFVAKNGIEFAQRIAAEKAGEAKFRFLQTENPYHVYFQHKIKLIQEGKEDENAPKGPASAGIDGDNDDSTTGTGSLAADVAKIVLKDKPPAPEFKADAPTIAAQDVDILKLTAQFVAKNGREFLKTLMQREAGNFQFDFLRPHHTLFHYFTSMVDQYSKMMNPKNDLLEKLTQNSESPFRVLRDMRYAAEWEKRVLRQKAAREAEEEKARVAYQQIDWHDFLLVETVEFLPEDTNLPPPVKMEDLGARLIEIENLERQKKEKERMQPTGKTDTMDMDMEESSDDEGAPQPHEPAANDKELFPTGPKEQPPPEQPNAQPAVRELPSAAPEPEKPEEIKIRPYNPKKPAGSGTVADGDQYLISPLTGERVLASKMAEHMRIGLLDPKWREQKDRLEAEMKKNQETWNLGQAATFKNLRDIADRRTDIFGRDELETDMGQKLETGQKKPMTWAGITESGMKDANRAKEEARALQEAANKKKREEEQRRRMEQEEEERWRRQRAGPVAPPGPPPGPPGLLTAPPMPGGGMAPPPPLGGPMGGPMGGFGQRSLPPGMGMPPGVRAPPPPPGGPGSKPGLAPLVAGAAPPPPLTITGRTPLSGGAGAPPPPRRPAVPPPPFPTGGAPPPPLGVPPPSDAPAAEPKTTPNAVVPAFVDLPTNKRPAPADEPTAPKRIRLDGLQVEEEWIKNNAMSFTCQIMCPMVPGKYDGGLKGQVLSFVVQLTDKVSTLKAKIQAETNLPPGKQTLKVGPHTLNNMNSLAFYNLQDGCAIGLTEKTRGGKRK